MNTAYRIVFNRARGTQMVANELTRSVQSKGTRTVVALAVAALGAAVAVPAAAAFSATVSVDGQETPLLVQPPFPNSSSVTASPLFITDDNKETAQTISSVSVDAIGPGTRPLSCSVFTIGLQSSPLSIR